MQFTVNMIVILSNMYAYFWKLKMYIDFIEVNGNDRGIESEVKFLPEKKNSEGKLTTVKCIINLIMSDLKAKVFFLNPDMNKLKEIASCANQRDIANKLRIRNLRRLLQQSRVRNSTLRRQLNAVQQKVHAMNRLISPAQKKILLGKKKTRWDDKDVIKAMTLKSTSKKAYKLVREVWKIPLPSDSTIERWMNGFECEPRFLRNVLDVMSQQGQTMDMFSKICILNFDEMSVSSEIVWDKRNDKIMGPHSNVQVVIARGLCSAWKQIIYYNFDTGMSKNLCETLIIHLEKIGFLVHGLVCDLGGKTKVCGKIYRSVRIILVLRIHLTKTVIFLFLQTFHI